MACLDFILQFSLSFDALLLPWPLVLPELCSPAREQKMLHYCCGLLFLEEAGACVA